MKEPIHFTCNINLINTFCFFLLSLRASICFCLFGSRTVPFFSCIGSFLYFEKIFFFLLGKGASSFWCVAYLGDLSIDKIEHCENWESQLGERCDISGENLLIEVLYMNFSVDLRVF